MCILLDVLKVPLTIMAPMHVYRRAMRSCVVCGNGVTRPRLLSTHGSLDCALHCPAFRWTQNVLLRCVGTTSKAGFFFMDKCCVSHLNAAAWTWMEDGSICCAYLYIILRAPDPPEQFCFQAGGKWMSIGSFFNAVETRRAFLICLPALGVEFWHLSRWMNAHASPWVMSPQAG